MATVLTYRHFGAGSACGQGERRTCGKRAEDGLCHSGTGFTIRDTDAAGVVFHSTYLNFHGARPGRVLRIQGFEPRELARRFRLVFIVRHLDSPIFKPAVLDDLVT